MIEGFLKQSYNGISSGVCSLDSFSDGCHTDIGAPGSEGIPAKGANGSRHSNRTIVSEDVDFREESLNGEVGIEGAHGMLHKFRKGISRPNHEWSKVVGDSESNTSEAKCNNQACCSIESHSIKSGKRNGKEKKFHQKSSGMHKLDTHRDTHHCKGKENDHSVWQRVQRNDIDGSTDKLKRIRHADSPPGMSKEAPLHQKHDKPHCIRRKQHEKIARSIFIDEMTADNEDLNKVPSISASYNILLKSKDGNLRSKVLCSKQEEQSRDTSEFQTDLLGVVCPSLADKIYKPKKIETNIFFGENSNRDHNMEFIVQKWVPVRKKETCMLDRNIPDNLLASHVDEPPKHGLYLKNSEAGHARFYSNLPSTNDGLACWGYESGLGNSLCPSDEGQQAEELRSQTPSVQEKQGCLDSKRNCCIWNVQKHSKFVTDASSTFEIDSDMISQMVNDACKLQIESEGIQLATCSPLAEFERLIHAASPVVEQKNYFQNCRTCLGDQPLGDALCSHQIPDVPLQSLWQWYEVPGIYGLEVKAEDHQTSKRLGSNQYSFCAYLVPFLSSVQLLGHCQCFACSENCWHDSIRNTASENSSDVGRLPILPMLLPKPQREWTASSYQSFDLLSTCDPCVSSNQHKLRNKLVTRACHDPELLFEYFESEQPYHRRTLFEKIQQLIRGDATSDSPVCGDPSTLNWRLPDLHPSSWYSVAWYPIYRIPDGNFRAAFLTYHSLGHFIKRASLDGITHIVSPVVGLQSYNAQEECWFELRKSTALQAEENSQFDHFEILKERVKTLERTASAMARARVCKADHESINRHPDYEFFVSRRQ